MHVGLQVLHVEGFYVVSGQFGHIVDEDFLARLVGVGFTADDAVRVLEQALEEFLLRDVSRQWRAGDTGFGWSGLEPGLGLCEEFDSQLLVYPVGEAAPGGQVHEVGSAVQRGAVVFDDVAQGLLEFVGDVVVAVPGLRYLQIQLRGRCSKARPW